MSRKIVIVKKSRKSSEVSFPLNVPVNVKVQGERTMLKQVRLVPVDDSREVVKVLTGHRGRPSLLPIAQIERVRAL